MSTAVDLLLETAQRGELHHAVIIHGPSPAPLRRAAVRVAKALNCLNGTTGDDCASCQKIDRRTHPDVHFTEVEAERKMISVEQVRELIAAATLRPYEGRNKVFIIDPADGLSISGSNALLKTLEEPARDTTFILLTRTPDLLLPTIRSRSQSIHVGSDDPPQIGATPEQRRLEQLASFENSGDRDTIARLAAAALIRFAQQGDSSALLSLAASIGGRDDVKDAMAAVAIVLTSDDEGVREIPRERRLAAADALLAGIRAMAVNADARLVIEGALAKLIG